MKAPVVDAPPASAPSSVQTSFFNPLDEPDWDRRVLEHPHGTVFHSSAWARVLAKTYGHTPFYHEHRFADGSRVCVPLMEVDSRLTGRRGVALPFSDHCEPLIFDADDVDEDALLERLVRLGADRGWKHIEIRGGRFPRWKSGLSFCAHRLDLRPGAEVLWERFSGSARRAVRKAENADLQVRVSRSEDDLFGFFRLHARTRRRHGAPPQPVDFFRHFHRELLERDLGFIVVVEKAGIAIAAAVFLKFGGSGVYKFGASDERYQQLRGNNMAMWAGIKQLCEDGCRSLDFGRSSIDNEGLKRFKLAWGSCEDMLVYYRYHLAQSAWMTWSDQASGRHARVFGNLPLSLNRWAGRLIYPHLD